jgi:glycosyltransferase involved in cell wall biosynthesis
MNPIKILHNTTTIGKTSFGIGQISVSLAQAQYALKHDVSIWCLDNDENIRWASRKHGFPAERITGFKIFGPRSLWFSPGVKRHARSDKYAIFDIVHQHGIWTGASSATLIFSKKKKVPTIIAPHGSLNQWVLHLSRWKKKIALAAYERDNLRLASCLHATSVSEISDFRNFGLHNPIAYIENGIQEKYLSVEGNAGRFREQNSVTGNKRILLFLSRISPKKGLTMLVEAINSIPDDFADWQLIIAGIEEFNHKQEVESMVKQLNLEDRIKIIGPLFDREKNDAFAAAELFILPSYSEGSPMVVLDSLAAGVPVITTKASSWGDLADYNCGWWTDISTPAITNALQEAVIMTAENLKQMGEQGKKLIASKYTWPQLAQKTLRLYDWLLGRDDKPDFVQLD